MQRLNRVLGFAVAAFLGIGSVASAQAAAVYQYSGLPFTNVTGVYTTADFVSGTITLANPLAANLSAASISASILSYSFSDGHQTLSGVTPTVAVVSTDASAIITAWAVGLGPFGAGGTPICTTRGVGAGLCSIFANADFATTAPATPGASSGVSLSPGAWTLVPEPASGVLLALSLAPFSLVRRRRAG